MRACTLATANELRRLTDVLLEALEDQVDPPALQAAHQLVTLESLRRGVEVLVMEVDR